jgi:hypothetical protein
MSETTNRPLREYVERLALLREEVAQRKSNLDALRAAFDASVAADARNLEACKRAVEAAEADVRGLALVTHTNTGSTKPMPGVQIVASKEYAIDEPAGLVWAQQTRLCLIPESLDVKAVKKLATVQALPFVRVLENPSVRIATDLAKALQESIVPAEAVTAPDVTPADETETLPWERAS